MHNVIGIDSDTKTIGYSYLRGGKIQQCGIIDRGPEYLDHELLPLWQPEYAVVEIPEVTRQWTQRGVDSNGLIKLAVAAGEIGAAISLQFDCPVYFIHPKTWKGTVPKAVSHQRISRDIGVDGVRRTTDFKVTDASHLNCLRLPSGKKVTGSNWSHVLDAIGISLWAQGKTLRSLSAMSVSRI